MPGNSAQNIGFNSRLKHHKFKRSYMVNESHYLYSTMYTCTCRIYMYRKRGNIGRDKKNEYRAK